MKTENILLTGAFLAAAAFIVKRNTGAIGCACNNHIGSTRTYYENELAKVVPGLTANAPTIKVFANGNGENTKHLSLNKTSADVLCDWLTENYTM